MDPSQFEKMFTQADSIMGPFADTLLRQAKFHLASNPKLTVLDTACGSGVVSSRLMSLLSLDAKSRLDLTCSDISDAMVSNVFRRIETAGWENARAVKADTMDTKFPSSHFTHIFFNFGPFILSNPLSGLRECRRILQPGGTLGFTTWKEVPWFADYRTGMATNPTIPPFPSDSELRHAFSDAPEQWNDMAEVQKHFEACEFNNIEVTVAENITKMNIEEVKAMMPYTLGMMIEKFWSKEDVDKYKEQAAKAILEFLREKYGGGPVVWKWVAIVATGTRA